MPYRRKSKNMGKKILTFIFILTLVIGGVGYWYYQRNIFSKDILKLEILGPDSADMGEEVEYAVKYKNNGDTRLAAPKLIFEYPEHSIVLDGKPLRQEMELDDIFPGEEKQFSFKCRLLGKEQESRVAKTWLNYQPKNLNARYESATTKITIIKYVPLTFEFDVSSKVDPGQEIKLRLNYFSNAYYYPLSNLKVVAEYPSGFEFLSSKPNALAKNEWNLGVLNKAEGGRIEVTGKISGDPGDQKIFNAKIGILQDGELVILKEATRGIEIIKPSIFISWQINGSPEYVAKPGEYLHYEIYFKNTGDKPLDNLFLITSLDDIVLDFSSMQSGSGKFQSSAKTIIWDQTSIPQLRFLDKMEEGKVDFFVKTKEELLGKNPQVKTTVTLSQVTEVIDTKISTKLVVDQKGLYAGGQITNSGPIPPRVGQVTSYNISWQIKNFNNEIKNLKVMAILPSQVRLTGEFLPKESKFSFDNASREIVWDVGDVTDGMGVSGPGPEITFQIALTPEEAQRGKPAELISEATALAEDSWTESIVEAKSPVIDTTLPDDTSLPEGRGIVQ